MKLLQQDLNKSRHKQVPNNISKAQLKKSEKVALQAWNVTNMPKDSVQMVNAVMYLENVLVAI